MSIEEKLNFYIATDKLNIFKKNANQALYFILEILQLLDILGNYRIKLMTNRLLFAVDNSNSTKWIYRVDDIGDFSYTKTQDIYDNCDYLVYIVNSLSNVVKDMKLVNFLNHILTAIEEMKKSNNQDLLGKLKNVINIEMEKMNVNMNENKCCIIQ